MMKSFSISAEWESLNEGAPDERACFGAIGIQANGQWLSEGRDSLANRLRQAPLLSGVHLAEWLAWNWWRLRWEPRSTTAEGWRFAHRTSNIGGGYIWPNITIFSDGERTALISRPMNPHPQEDTSFRYISNSAVVIPSFEFERGIDEFFVQIVSRLEEEGVADSNFIQLCSDLSAERSDPKIAQSRKLEAMLGMDPDEAGSEWIANLILEGKTIGEGAVNELAANRWNTKNNEIPSVEKLTDLSKNSGFDSSPKSMIQLTNSLVELRRKSEIPAWMVGAQAAKALREQEHLSGNVISNTRLADFLGVQEKVFSIDTNSGSSFPYAFDIAPNLSKIVLRSKHGDGRRFELARLLGDRLLTNEGALFPSTKAYTYRQKIQRSFAAELLCPFECLVNMLQSDYSAESLQEMGEHFGVSELTIRTQLVNHKILEREELDSEVFSAVA